MCENTNLFYDFLCFLYKSCAQKWWEKEEGKQTGAGEQYFIPKLPYTRVLSTELGPNKIIDTKWRQSYFLLWATMWPIWEILCPVLSLHYKRGVDKLKDVQQKITKTVCRWVHVGYVERLKEQPGGESWCRGLAGGFSYPTGKMLCRRQRQAALMDAQGKDKKQKPQLAARESPPEHRKQLLTLGEAEDGHRVWRKAGTSILGELQKSAGPLSD